MDELYILYHIGVDGWGGGGGGGGVKLKYVTISTFLDAVRLCYRIPYAIKIQSQLLLFMISELK